MWSGRDIARLFAVGNGGDTVVDRVPELFAAGSADGFDVAETHSEIGVGFIDGNTDEGVAVVDADLGDVVRVVADGDGVPNERGKRRCEVALTLEVDAVSLHDAAFRDGEQ